MAEKTRRRAQEWSIQDIARAAGTTSRTLRHYDAIGLLKPSRTGANGYRYYDQHALVRLQRILLLRELGLGLPEIAEVLEGQRDTASALRAHLELLERERERLWRQIMAVRATLRKLQEGERLMPREMFNGFEHTQYKDEVIERWGRTAYQRSDNWWRSLSDKRKAEFTEREQDIAAGFGRLVRAGESPDGQRAQELTGQLYEWIRAGWQGQSPTSEQFTGLGQLYVDDPRFTAHYDTHAPGTAKFIRDAIAAYAERNL